MHFQLFQKKEKFIVCALPGYIFREPRNMRHTRYREDFCISGYLPCLAPVPNTVRLITAEIGSPTYFFSEEHFTQRLQSFYSARARWLRKRSRSRSHVADVSCMTFFEFVLPRHILCGSKRTAFQRESRYMRRLLNNFALLRERKAFGRFGARSHGKRDPTWWPRELRRSIPTHFRNSYTTVAARISISRDAYRTIWRTELDLATSLQRFARFYDARVFSLYLQFFQSYSNCFYFPYNVFSTVLCLYQYVITYIPRLFVFWIRSDIACS